MALTLVPPHQRPTESVVRGRLANRSSVKRATARPSAWILVGRAPVNPGVAARPARAEPEATRAQAVRDDPTEAGPVQREKGRSVPGGGPIAKEVADAAQIALSLLAHGCREEEGAGECGTRLHDHPGERQQRRQPAAVVGDARPDQPAPLLPNVYVCPLWEDGVEMSGQDQGGLAAAPPPEHVALAVGFDAGEDGFCHQLGHARGPRLLA